jgi:PAS domain S-box-containing protein
VKQLNNEFFLKLTQASKEIISDFLMDYLPANIFLVDKNGYVCWANNHLQKTVKLSLKELQGMHISSWGNMRWEYIQEVIINKHETTREEQYEGIYYSTIRKPVFDENGEVIGLLGLAIEITDRKRAEIAKDQFLHNIRHDIRTPVSGMIGLASILKESIHDSKLIEFTSALVSTSESLLHVLDRVFEAVQFSTGEIPILYQRFSLKDTLESVYQLYQAKAIERKLNLNFYYDPALPYHMIGSAMRVQRIAWELLANALKYTDKGLVNFSAHLLEQDEKKIVVEIQVQDTGIGIAEDQQEIIFHKFTRLTPSWLGDTQGQGLGLFNVRQLASDLGAEISLDSALHEGSTFSCKIPFKPVSLFEKVSNLLSPDENSKS